MSVPSRRRIGQKRSQPPIARETLVYRNHFLRTRVRISSIGHLKSAGCSRQDYRPMISIMSVFFIPPSRWSWPRVRNVGPNLDRGGALSNPGLVFHARRTLPSAWQFLFFQPPVVKPLVSVQPRIHASDSNRSPCAPLRLSILHKVSSRVFFHARRDFVDRVVPRMSPSGATRPSQPAASADSGVS